jgi:hypothetical protein
VSQIRRERVIAFLNELGVDGALGVPVPSVIELTRGHVVVSEYMRDTKGNKYVAADGEVAKRRVAVPIVG